MCPFTLFGGPTKIDYRLQKKVGTHILTSLLEDLVYILGSPFLVSYRSVLIVQGYLTHSFQPPKTLGKQIRFLKGTMVEKNGLGIHP